VDYGLVNSGLLDQRSQISIRFRGVTAADNVPISIAILQPVVE